MVEFTISNGLITAFRKRHVTVVTGPALSICARLPSLDKIVRPLAESIAFKLPPEELTTTEHLVRASQFYEDTMGRQSLVSHFKEQLETTGINFTQIHSLISRLPTDTILTTNYDDLQERAFIGNGLKIHTVLTDTDLSFTTVDATTLIKWLGSLDQPRTLIITQRDHQYAHHERSFFQHRIPYLLQSRTLLFIGFDCEDSGFDRLYYDLRPSINKYQPLDYFIHITGLNRNLEGPLPTNIKAIDLPYNESLANQSHDKNQYYVAILTEFVKFLLENTLGADSSRAIEKSETYQVLERLIYSSGFELIEKRPSSGDLLLEKKDLLLGVRVIVRFETSPVEKVNPEKVLAFYQEIEAAQANIGFLISFGGFTDRALQVVNDLRHSQLLRLFTEEEFIRKWIDFTPYLDELAQAWEKSPISKYYLDIHLYQADERKTLTEMIQRWLHDSESGPIAVLGDWGTGKSVFCERLAYEVSQLYIHYEKNCRVPILIRLSDLIGNFDILEYAVESIETAGIKINRELISELVRQGRILWILDGLDEIGTQLNRLDFRKALYHIHRLAKAKNNKLVITSRIQFFTGVFEEVQLLKDYNILYLKRWSELEFNAYLDNRLGLGWQNRFQLPEVVEARLLTEFFAIPLCLSMIAEIIPGIETDQKIPLNTTDLFDNFVERWIKRQSERALLPSDERRRFIEVLAFEMWTKGRIYLPHDELRRAVREKLQLLTMDELDRFDTDIRTCSFLTRNDEGDYRFSHRSFLEFFVTKYIVREIRTAGADLAKLASQVEDSIGTVSRIYQDSEPYEGVMFFLLRMLTPEDFLKLNNLLSHPDPITRMVSVRVLGSTRLPHWRDPFRQLLTVEKDTLVRRQIYISLGRVGDTQATDEYVSLLESNRILRDENKEYTLKFFGGLENTLETISARLRNQDLQHMWIIDVLTLEDIGHPRCIPILENLRFDRPDMRQHIERALEHLRIQVPKLEE